MLIHRNVIKSLHPATNANDTRYGTAMSGIYISPESRECIATDGHILVRAAAPTLDNAGEWARRINGDDTINPSADVSGVLDAAALLTAAKATPKRPCVPVLANVAVTSPTTFVTTDLEHATTNSGRDLHDETFPSYRKIINVPKDANTFTLSAELLATIVKVARAQGASKAEAAITFHIIPKQETNAVYFTVRDSGDSPKIDGVVMPMRI